MAVTGRAFPSHQIRFPQPSQLAAGGGSTSVTVTPDTPATASASAPLPVWSITLLSLVLLLTGSGTLPGSGTIPGEGPIALESAPTPILPVSGTFLPPPASASATAGTTSFLDTFTRTNAANWDGSWIDAGFTGTNWTFSENGTQGLATPTGSGPQGRRLQDTMTDGDWYVDLKFSSAAVGAAQEAGIMTRFLNTDNYVRLMLRTFPSANPQLRIETNRAATTVLLGSFTSSTLNAVANTMTLHFQLAGLTANARAWQTGTTEPTSWQVTAALDAILDNPSGASGLRANTSSGNSNLAVVSFDNSQTVFSPNAPTPVITLFPPAPTVTESIPTIAIVSAFVSSATAAGSAPTPVVEILMLAPAPTATASTTADFLIIPVVLDNSAGASASVPAPIVAISMLPAASGATGSAPTPTPNLAVISSAPGATASASSPTVGGVVNAPMGAASGSSSSPSLSITVPVGTTFSSASFDSFSRPLTNTWGSANTGEPWTIQSTLLPSSSLLSSSLLTPDSGGTISVDTTKGIFTQSESLESLLATITDFRFDSDVSADLNWTTTPTGDWNQTGVVLRFADNLNYFMAGLRQYADGTAELRIDRVTSGSFSPIASLPASFSLSGATYRLKARVQGSSMWAKFWPIADDEPTWQLQGTQLPNDPLSGSSGVFFLPSSSATDVQTVNYDTFSASQPSLAQTEALNPIIVTAYAVSVAPGGTTSVPVPSLLTTIGSQAASSATVPLPICTIDVAADPASAASLDVFPIITTGSPDAQAASAASVPLPSLTIVASATSAAASASTSAAPDVTLSTSRATAASTVPAATFAVVVIPQAAIAGAAVPTITLRVTLVSPAASADETIPIISVGVTTLFSIPVARATASASGRVLDRRRFKGWAANPAPQTFLPVDSGTVNTLTLSVNLQFHIAPVPTGTYLAIQAAHHHGQRTYSYTNGWRPATYDHVLPDGSVQAIAFGESDEARLGVISQGGTSYLTAGFSEQTPTLSTMPIVRNQNYRLDMQANCEAGIWTIDWQINLVVQSRVTTLRRREAFVFDRTPSQWRQTVLAPDAFPTYNDFDLIGYTSNPALTPYPLD